MRITILLIIFNLSLVAQQSNWTNNIDSAKYQSLKKNRYILLKFTGSDWCANCKYLEKSLFHKPDFIAYANNKLVLLEADFPMKRKNQLSKKQQLENDSLAAKYNKKGVFPLVLILNDRGDIVFTLNSSPKNKSDYLKQIQSAIQKLQHN